MKLLKGFFYAYTDFCLTVNSPEAILADNAARRLSWRLKEEEEHEEEQRGKPWMAPKSVAVVAEGAVDNR